MTHTENKPMPDVIYVGKVEGKQYFSERPIWNNELETKYIRAPAPQVTDEVVKEAVRHAKLRLGDTNWREQYIRVGVEELKTLIQAALRPAQTVTVDTEVVEAIRYAINTFRGDQRTCPEKAEEKLSEALALLEKKGE